MLMQSWKSKTAALGLLLGTSLAQAENIGSELGKEQGEESTGYFQIGVGGGWSDRSIEGDFEDFGGVFVEGRYAWHGLFVEVSNDNIGVPGFALGYELWDSEQWAVDLVAIPMGGLDPENFDRLKGNGLQDREGFTLTGVRATRFFDDFILQGHVLPLGEGPVVALAIGKFWQVKNWSVSALAALRYDSADVNDKTWSVGASEASVAFPEYEAGAGISASMVLRAEYPITENWVFETSAFYGRTDDAVADSPLIVKQQAKGVAFELSYVF